MTLYFSRMSLNADSRDFFLNPLLKRPIPEKRLVQNQVLEEYIEKVKANIKDPHLAQIFQKAFFCSLDSCLVFSNDHGVPITGILTQGKDDKWLKESTLQIWPYLPWINKEPSISKLFDGLIRNQSRFILSNWKSKELGTIGSSAIVSDKTNSSGTYLDIQSNNQTGLSLEGLCYFVRLSFHFWKECQCQNTFDADWWHTVSLIHSHFDLLKLNSGSLTGLGKPLFMEELLEVPIYLFVIKCQSYLNEILGFCSNENTAFDGFSSLFDSKESEKKRNFNNLNALTENTFPYAIDSRGNHVFYEEGLNLGLLDLPYLGVISSLKAEFKATQEFIFSKKNPYFFQGMLGEGIGSFSLDLGEIATKSLIIRALNSINDFEIWDCIRSLVESHKHLGALSEAFNVDSKFQKPIKESPIANSLFSELILRIYEERPYLLASKI